MKIIQSTIERFLYILLFLVFILMGLSMLVLYQANTRLSHRVNFFQHELETNHQLADQNKALSKQIRDGVNGLNRHMDCILNFFALPNRANLTIDDVANCAIQENPTISSGPVVTTGPLMVISPPPTPIINQPAVTPMPSPNNSKSNNGNGQNKHLNTSNKGGV